ncbi:MAG: c-type cytochrome [Gammaproteobacteria bacterium]
MSRWVPLLALAALPWAALAADGPTLYRQCAACHLPSGAGVPGTYPPLASADFRRQVISPGGRRYLVLVVLKGVIGPLTVDGKQYFSVMPAQSLDDAGVAGVLNHVARDIARVGDGFQAFTPEEVAAVRAADAGLSAQQVAALHATLGTK